jgi:hypothetical protein
MPAASATPILSPWTLVIVDQHRAVIETGRGEVASWTPYSISFRTTTWCTSAGRPSSSLVSPVSRLEADPSAVLNAGFLAHRAHRGCCGQCLCRYRPQLAENWFTRLNVPRRDIGTRHDRRRVEMGAQIDFRRSTRTGTPSPARGHRRAFDPRSSTRWSIQPGARAIVRGGLLGRVAVRLGGLARVHPATS